MIFYIIASYEIEKRAFGKPFNPKCMKSNVSGNCLALQRKPNQFQRKEGYLFYNVLYTTKI